MADVARCQIVSSRFLALARDNGVWKLRCFQHSRAEALRRRQRERDSHDPHLEELRSAISNLPSVSPSIPRSDANGTSATAADVSAVDQRQRARALANWEPGYPGEIINYYEEYIHRHADVNIEWIKLPGDSHAGDRHQIKEATGVGILSQSDSAVQHMVSPLDDGSVCLWDVTARSTYPRGGRGCLVGQSRPGMLTAGASPDRSHAIMTETGAVECVSIDSRTKKGYFGVENLLQEVDLQTLQIASTKKYPFPITALSPSQPGLPLSVGTNCTVHLHDAREPTMARDPMRSESVELIGGTLDSHATLSQPGPLSILGHQESSSIWVAGRFTSLLNYDLRRFPRLLGTIHSGARIASLASLPHPFVPRSLDLVREPGVSMSALQAARSRPGMTLLAAAEYKGKGSLELHDPTSQDSYKNRQTASASKLLSAVPHGGRIVFSDGDGNLRWMERDGSTLVRKYNINSGQDEPSTGEIMSNGIFSTSGSEMPGQGDIVQKMLPLRAAAGSDPSDRSDLPSESLLLWSGDGRLGCLNFGGQNPLTPDDDWHDALEAQGLSAEEKAKEDAARQYEMTMRRALERNADEVRFVRGLGMAAF